MASTATERFALVVLGLLLLAPIAGFVGISVARERGWGCDVEAGDEICADGNAYGFAALVLTAAIALLVLTVHVAYEAWRDNAADTRAVARAVIIIGAVSIAAVGVLLTTFGGVILGSPILFAAWLFLMIHRESTLVAAPALALVGGCAAWLCRTAAQGGELLLFLPFAAVVAWAGLAAALLRLRADYVEWAGR